MPKTEQIHIRLDKTLLHAIDTLAKEKGHKRSGYIRYVLQQRVDQEMASKEMRGEVEK